MNDYNFGNFVCRLREEKGMTQAELADMLGVTAAAVSKWENGASKPKIDILFSLAKIFGVTPEELMAGRFLNGERLNEETVKRIREEYEYLTKVSSYQNVGVKVRRIAAFIIDGITAILITYPVVSLLSLIFGSVNTRGCFINTLFIYLFNCTIPYIYLFFRDFIWFGRSLGKRITGLIIIDRKTAEKAGKTQTVIHNMFASMYIIDFAVVLFSGRAIGDYVANALVVSKKDYMSCNAEKYDEKEIIQQMENYVKSEYKRVFKDLICIVVGCLMIIPVVIFGYIGSKERYDMLEDTDERKTAHEYLINSEIFKDLGYIEDEILVVEQVYSVIYEDGKLVDYVIIVYQVRWGEFTVVCHDKDDGWYVCPDCTDFE